MKIVFMGTPEIAGEILKTLIASEHEVACVVTQTDKPKGRGQGVVFSEVKQIALEAGIPVLQPEKASDPGFIEKLRSYGAEMIVVAAYGKLLREEILNMPEYGCINVHASLLPKYRGAAPIQWCIIDGEEKTGITIMHMEKGLDTGNIILQEELILAPDETAGSLYDKLAAMGGPVLLKAMKQLEDGTAQSIPQDNDKATYVSVLTKEMGELDFGMSAAALERRIRGLIPWPGAFSHLDGRLFKIWKTALVTDGSLTEGLVCEPGKLYVINKKRMLVGTGEGFLELLEIQAEGKKRMDIVSFLNGAGINEYRLGK